MPCRIPSSFAVSGLRSPCIWAGRELSSFNAQVFPLWIAWPPSPHSGQDHITTYSDLNYSWCFIFKDSMQQALASNLPGTQSHHGVVFYSFQWLCV